jgi:hypothetical protein
MVKVSITLPNSAQISLEAEEAEIIHGVVGIVLRDLPRDLMNHVQPPDGTAPPPPELEKGISVQGAMLTERPDPAHQATGDARDKASNAEPAPRSSAGEGGRQRAATQSSITQDSGGQGAPIRDPRSPEQESSFAEFCRSANPMGDMRRVVVASEGASRILGMPSVDAEDLAWLFDLAGWRRAQNFTQTLRNAARDKFRWLERVPGRAGKYAATELGRSVTLSG